LDKENSIFNFFKNKLRQIVAPGSTLSEKTIKGGFWVFTIRIADRLFQLVRTIILARLLSPNDFGLFGIALLVLSTLETFSEAGFRHALIQKKGDTGQYLNTTWTVGIIRGFFIAAIVFLSARPIAIFFKAAAAENILRVIGLAIILESLTNVSILYFQKELRFYKYFQYRFLGTIVDVVVAISAAYLLKSVWALVFGLLAGNLVRCITSYIISPYRPKLQLNMPMAKELFGFGKWIMGSSILLFLITHGDDAFVGKILGTTMLGFYQMAYKISNLPATEITQVISQVSFPAYSKLQDKLERLREAYLKVLKLTSFISFPVAGLVFALAPEFTSIFLGDKWMPMVPAMQALAVWGLIRSFGATTGPLFMGIGKPRFATILQFIQFIILASLISSFSIRWGILGTSIAVVAAALVTNIIGGYVVVKLIKCKKADFLKVVLFPLLNTVIIVSALYLIKVYLINSFTITGFIVVVLAGIIIFSLLLYLFDKFFDYKILSFFKNEIILRKKNKNFTGK